MVVCMHIINNFVDADMNIEKIGKESIEEDSKEVVTSSHLMKR